MTANEDFDMSAFEDTFVENDGGDTFVGNNEDGLEQILRDGEGDFTSERKHQKFQRMVEDSKTPLFSGCDKEHTNLHTVLSLLQLKASNRWSDTSFREFLLFLKKLLPKKNVL